MMLLQPSVATLLVAVVALRPCLCVRDSDARLIRSRSAAWSWKHVKSQDRRLPILGDVPGGVDGNTTGAAEDAHVEDGSQMSTQQHLMHIAGGVGILALLLTVFAWTFRRRQPQDPPVEAPETEDGPVSAGDAAAGGSNIVDADSIEGQLSGLRKKKYKILMDQAMNKQRLEKIVGSIMEVEAAMSQEKAPTDEEIERKTMETLKATDIAVEQKLLSALAYVAPMAMQSQRVYTAIEKRTQEVQDKVKALAYQETMNLATDFNQIFDIQDIRGSIFENISGIEMPSLATLLASALAPAQLRLLDLSEKLKLVMGALAISFSLGCLLWDDRTLWHSGCACLGWFSGIFKRELLIWYSVDFGMGTFCILVRLWVAKRVGDLLRSLDEAPPVIIEEDPVRALKTLIDYYLTTGCDALARLEEVSSSFLNDLVQWTVIFDVLWMIYAVDLVCNTPWSSCMTASLVVLRLRVMFFFIFLGPVVINLAFFILNRFLSGQAFQLKAIAAADSIDDFLGLGVPVASIVVYAMTVRNRKDMVKLQLRAVEVKRAQLDLRRKEAEAQLAQIMKSVNAMDGQLQGLKAEHGEEAKLTPQETQAKMAKAKQQILDDAEKVFVRVNAQAQVASLKAKEQVKEWEEGGGPEIFKAMAKGEGLDTVQQWAKEVDYAKLSREAMESTQAAAEAFGQQEWVQQAMAKGAEAAEDLKKSDKVQLAMAKGAELTENLKKNEKVQQAMAKGTEVVEDLKKNEKVQQAMAKGAEAAEDFKRNEKVQQAMATGAEAMEDLKKNEEVQQDMAKGVEAVEDK